MNLVLRVKELARQRRMTMQQVADAMEINPSNLISSLKGNPTLSRLEDVAKVLDVELSDLFVSDKKKVWGVLSIDGNVHMIDNAMQLKELVSTLE